MSTEVAKLSLAAIFLTLFLTPAFSGQRVVDCDRGGSLQKALETGASSASPVWIYFTGTCFEDISINRDRVAIIGDGASTIQGHVMILGSDNIRLIDLTITRPGPGVSAYNGRLQLIRVRLVGNEGNGIALFQNASATIRQSEVRNNTGSGLEIGQGSHLSLVNSVVSEQEAGIIVHSANVDIGEGSVVSNNWDAGVLVLDGGHVSLANSEVSNHSGTGIFVRNGSTVLLVNASVTSNWEGAVLTGGSILVTGDTTIAENTSNGIRAELHSRVQIDDAAIYENGGAGIWLQFDSGLLNPFGNADIHSNLEGNVFCADTESSAMFHGEPPSDVSCTDFNQVAPD